MVFVQRLFSSPFAASHASGKRSELTQDVPCSPAALADQPLQKAEDDYPQVGGHEDQEDSTDNICKNCT